MKFYTKRDIEFNKGINLTKEDGSVINFPGYRGATKIISYGEESFRDSLIREHGVKKAEEIMKKSSNRGNDIHEKLETEYKTMLPSALLNQLGEQVDYEVFTWGNVFGVDAIGFVDSLFIKDDIYTILDYKTKNHPYRGQSYTKYWMQMVIYMMLMTKQYGIDPKKVKLCTTLLYVDGSPVDFTFLDSLQQMRMYASAVRTKCQDIRSNA